MNSISSSGKKVTIAEMEAAMAINVTGLLAAAQVIYRMLCAQHPFAFS